jgi:RsiW-degrading membrane proteinase PrsW (M82 family)
MEPLWVKAVVGLAPVVICLIAFERFDAFRLVSTSEVAILLGAGAALAAGSYFANSGVMDQFPVGFTNYTRIGAPLLEETLKAAFIVLLFALNRIGYLIDAAIAGFAVGTGFALAENLFFLQQFGGANIGTWVVRGFGTAIMHGGASAIMAVLSMVLYAPRLRMDATKFHFNLFLFLPGLAAAIAMHAAFNYFHQASLEAMAVVLLSVPLSLFAIFSQGETYAHRWLVQDRAAHTKLLDDIRSGTFDESPEGRAVQALANRLNPQGAQDLFDYVRTNVELVVRADDTLLSLEDHERVALDDSVRQQLHHLHDLERRLGRSTVMAARQHLHVSRDDLWKMHELEMDSSRRDLRA